MVAIKVDVRLILSLVLFGLGWFEGRIWIDIRRLRCSGPKDSLNITYLRFLHWEAS